jgi:hypothetical protein
MFSSWYNGKIADFVLNNNLSLTQPYQTMSLTVYLLNVIALETKLNKVFITGTCFIQKIYAPSSSLLQGKHLHFSPSPLRLNSFRLFVILSLSQLYRYTPEIFLFTTATFKYTYRAPLRRIGQEYQRT